MIKRKTAIDYHQMLPWYVGQFKPKTSNISVETVKEVLKTAEKPMSEKKTFWENK